jgi:hypothetical protein
MRSLIAAALLLAAGCASPAPDTVGPPNERTFPAPFERVWEAAQSAVPGVWGQRARSKDEANGVLIFPPRLIASSAPKTQEYRLLAPEQTLGQQLTQDLSVYVSRGSESGTRVSVRLEMSSPSSSGDESPGDDRMARKILDAIEKELKK